MFTIMYGFVLKKGLNSFILNNIKQNISLKRQPAETTAGFFRVTIGMYTGAFLRVSIRKLRKQKRERI